MRGCHENFIKLEEKNMRKFFTSDFLKLTVAQQMDKMYINKIRDARQIVVKEDPSVQISIETRPRGTRARFPHPVFTISNPTACSGPSNDIVRVDLIGSTKRPRRFYRRGPHWFPLDRFRS